MENPTDPRSTVGPALPNSPATGAADPDQHVTAAIPLPVAAAPPIPSPAKPTSRPWWKWLLLGVAVVGLVVGARFAFPAVDTMLNTVSTDDAYVNGHVTFVAPRVAGQVTKVLVDDNKRVKKGDVLVQLDKEPYQVQLAIKQAAVTAAESDLEAAKAQVQALVGQTRAYKFKLDHAIEDVDNQIANLRANVATLKSRQATLDLARRNLKRGEELAPSGGISKEDLDQRKQQVKVADAAVEQALQTVYANRVSLGLPQEPAKGQLSEEQAALFDLLRQRGPQSLKDAATALGKTEDAVKLLARKLRERDLIETKDAKYQLLHDLGEVPDDLDQTFSTVRQALAALIQSAAQLGFFPASWDATPKETVQAFKKQDPEGNVDRIYAKIIPNAPARKQAEAKLVQARRDLAQAELNLRYCDVVSEIDGVVTSRNVNPGNNVSVGQNLMAVRSLTEIWIDANFKETQLADLRIGQQVRLEVDMYGSRREFNGYISGFTMGTGQTLALLPPQNATGNFVKIVQRLPVRIELTDYNPDDQTLFNGLSVVPYVYFKKTLVDKDIPGKGQKLQPLAPLPTGPTDPRP